MILTVTPNAAVDKTYRVEGFALDKVHRPTQTFTVAGGKGINVARVYQTLGGTAITTGFLGGTHGRIVAKALATEKIADEFVTVRGESRLCIAIVDPLHGTQTEVNERGPEISHRNLRTLERKIESLLSQHAFKCVILSGSLPPGVPAHYYADLIERIQAKSVPVVLDASGEALRIGVQVRPWMVKPNRVEMEAVLGRAIQSDTELLQAGQDLCASGISIVAVTRGAEGAYLITSSQSWEAVPPKIEFASAVASGDSFVAAFLWQYFHGTPQADIAQSFRLATGAGAANAAVIGAGFCTRESIFALAAKAELRNL